MLTHKNRTLIAGLALLTGTLISACGQQAAPPAEPMPEESAEGVDPAAVEAGEPLEATLPESPEAMAEHEAPIEEAPATEPAEGTTDEPAASPN